MFKLFIRKGSKTKNSKPNRTYKVIVHGDACFSH